MEGEDLGIAKPFSDQSLFSFILRFQKGTIVFPILPPERDENYIHLFSEEQDI